MWSVHELWQGFSGDDAPSNLNYCMVLCYFKHLQDKGYNFPRLLNRSFTVGLAERS